MNLADVTTVFCCSEDWLPHLKNCLSPWLGNSQVGNNWICTCSGQPDISTRMPNVVQTRHKSMLDYLYNAGFTKTFNELRTEVPELVGSPKAIFQIRVVLIFSWLKSNFTPDPTSPASGLLVKKWTSIIRMQRKVEGDLNLV